MTLVNPYCTTAELRDQVGDTGARLPEPLLNRAINASSRAIDSHCGRLPSGSMRRFWKDTLVTARTYAPTGSHELLVDDIATRDGLIVKTGSDGETFSATLTAGVDYLLEPRNADTVASGDTAAAYAFWRVRLLGGARFTCLSDGRPTVEVTARHGWSAVPYQVQAAALIKATAILKRKDAPFGVAGFGEFGTAVRITRADPDVIDLLTEFQIVNGFA